MQPLLTHQKSTNLHTLATPCRTLRMKLFGRIKQKSACFWQMLIAGRKNYCVTRPSRRRPRLIAIVKLSTSSNPITYDDKKKHEMLAIVMLARRRRLQGVHAHAFRRTSGVYERRRCGTRSILSFCLGIVAISEHLHG